MPNEATKVQDIERGNRLREERTRIGMTIVAFAALGGVKKGSQILYEKGSPPSADYLALIVHLGVDVLYVLTGRRDLSLSHYGKGPVDTWIAGLIAQHGAKTTTTGE